MRLSRALFCFLIGIFLISFVSAQFFDFYYLRPSMILENEWTVFILLFGLFFSLVYIALNNFFLRRRGGEGNRGAAVVISLVVGVIAASSIVQRTLWYGYFGDQVINFLYIALAIGGILCLIPLFNYLRGSFGGPPAIFAVLLVLWAVIKWFMDPTGNTMFSNFVWKYNMWQWFDFYDFVSSNYVGGILALLLLVTSFATPYIGRRGGGGAGAGAGAAGA